MKQFFIRRWFLLALAAVLVVGISQAQRLEAISDLSVIRKIIVATVLFLMSLSLDAGAMWKALRRPGPPLLASAINFGLLPLIAWGISFGMRDAFVPGLDEMAKGLFVAATTPSTLASGVVWTRRAGGNDSVALLVTLLTNVSCFVLTPLWLLWMTGQRYEIPGFAPYEMILRLALLVVLPMGLAQLLRLWKPLARWAEAKRIMLGVFAQFGVLSMIFLGAVNTGLKFSDGISSQLLPISIMVVIVLGIHLAMLAVGMWLASLLSFAREDQIAVGISGSQKTLMIGLTVGLELNLSVLPIVTYHVGQLLLDTVIADRLRRKSERNDSA